jgi:glyoxylase-like metal-dependent hydrolase (beta-lactamase superfamily II)
MSQQPDVIGFFHEPTSSVSYLVVDPETRACAIVDAVLDYDPSGGRTSTQSAEQILAAVRDRDLTVTWILETHVHADHLSAAEFLRRATGAQAAIGAEVVGVQKYFGALFHSADTILPDGGDFDHLFQDGERFMIGNIAAQTLHTPGHTPACMAYLVGNALFVGDTLFMPDYGTARCDFPGGNAGQLYRSIQRLLAMPDATRIFVGHDYAPHGRAIQWEASVKTQREQNIHLKDGVSEADYIAMRNARDRTLALPALILPSVQMNIRAGAPPPPEANGVSYLKIPLDRF